MENWVGSSLIVIASLAAASALISIGTWVGKVNSDRNAFIEFMQETRNDIKEIRASINHIFIMLDPQAKSSIPNRLQPRDRINRSATSSKGSSASSRRIQALGISSSPFQAP